MQKEKQLYQVSRDWLAQPHLCIKWLDRLDNYIGDRDQQNACYAAEIGQHVAMLCEIKNDRFPWQSGKFDALHNLLLAGDYATARMLVREVKFRVETAYFAMRAYKSDTVIDNKDLKRGHNEYKSETPGKKRTKKRKWDSLCEDLLAAWISTMTSKGQWIPRRTFIESFLNGKSNKIWREVSPSTIYKRFDDNPECWVTKAHAFKTT